jgi:hypothetical protein
MRFMKGVRIRTADPEVRTSLCGMTSLFLTTSVAPRVSVIDWAARYGPLLNDHV